MTSLAMDDSVSSNYVATIILHIEAAPQTSQSESCSSETMGQVEGRRMVKVECIVKSSSSRRRSRPGMTLGQSMALNSIVRKSRAISTMSFGFPSSFSRKNSNRISSRRTSYRPNQQAVEEPEHVLLEEFSRCLKQVDIGDRIVLTLDSVGLVLKYEVLKAIRASDVQIKSDRYTMYLTVQKRYQSLREVSMKKTVVRQTMGLLAAKRLYKFTKITRLYIFGGILPQICYVLSMLHIHIKPFRDIFPVKDGLYYLTGITALISFVLLIPPMQMDTIRAILERFETYYLMYHGFSMNLMTYIIFQYDLKRVFATLISQTSCIIFALTHDTRHSSFGEIEAANFVTLFSCGLSLVLWFYFTKDLEEPLNHEPLLTVHYGGGPIPIYPHTLLVGNIFTLVLFFSKSLFRSSNMMKNIRARLTLERFQPERHMKRVSYMEPKATVNQYDTSLKIHRKKRKAKVGPSSAAETRSKSQAFHGKVYLAVDASKRLFMSHFDTLNPPGDTVLEDEPSDTKRILSSKVEDTFPLEKLLTWVNTGTEQAFISGSACHTMDRYHFTIAVDQTYASMYGIDIKATIGPYLLGRAGFRTFLRFAKITNMVNIGAVTCAFIVSTSTYMVLDFGHAKNTIFYTEGFAIFSMCALIFQALLSIMFVNRQILCNLSIWQFDVWYQVSLVVLANFSLWYLLSGTLIRYWLAKVLIELLFGPFLDATFPTERLRRNVARPMFLGTFALIYTTFCIGVLVSGSSITNEKVPVITYFNIGSLHTIKVNFLGIFMSTSTLNCIYLIRNTFYAIFYHNYLTGFTAPVVRHRVRGEQLYKKQYERQELFALHTKSLGALSRKARMENLRKSTVGNGKQPPSIDANSTT